MDELDSTRPRLEAAESLLRSGRVGQAVGALRALVAEAPNFAPAHYQLALALETAGNRAGAETALRATLALDPAWAEAATRLAKILIARQQPDEAVKILDPFIKAPTADINLHTVQGQALKMLGRLEDAVDAYGRAADIAPASGVAEHNLAGALGDAERFTESEAAASRAFAKGLDAPETWLVHGRALQGLYEFEAAEAAFRQAIERRPAYADAHADLAQLVWMRTEDIDLACVALDAALRVNPADGPLSMAKAKLLEYVGDPVRGYEILVETIARRGDDAALHVNASWLILAKDPHLALTHAEKAFAASPDKGPAATALCQANLAVGRAEMAARIAETLCRAWPLDQHPIALAATAWRMMGDARYRDLYDYEHFVCARILDTPPGWSSLNAYLSDLAACLRSLHRLRAHPIGQSLRHGTQTGQSLTRSDDPVIKALFIALAAPIRDYIDSLKRGGGGFGRRATEGYRFAGAWSVMLRPGGFHVDHIHPKGWISSACHIDLPEAVETGHEGWLKFGEPGLPTEPHLGPEHFIKPKAGQLTLFPSYMWHGTVPFSGEAPRLSVAFDIVPA